jgi:hypothetical protein
MVKRRLVLATTLALFGLAACQLVLGLEKPTEYDPVSDAGGDGGMDGGVDSTCVPSEFPGPPETDSPRLDSTSGESAYYMAVRAFSVGGDGNLPGANLDCVDTVCSADKPAALSCVPREGGADLCDEPNGVDNQVGRVVMKKFLLDVDEQLGAEAIYAGKYGQVIVLKGYNGLPNDRNVGVGFAPSPGFFESESGCTPLAVLDSGAGDAAPKFCRAPGTSCSETDGGCCGNCTDGGCSALPRWDGCDKWLQDDRYSTGSLPVLVEGYVRDSVLYVPPTDGRPFPLQLGRAVATLQAAGLVARVERVDDFGMPSAPASPARRLRLRNARVFGRVSSAQLLEFVTRFRLANSGACLPYFPFASLRVEVCKSQDVALALTSSGTCDAFSMGFRFETEAAERGVGGRASIREPCLEGIPEDASIRSFLDGSLLDCP